MHNPGKVQTGLTNSSILAQPSVMAVLGNFLHIEVIIPIFASARLQARKIDPETLT